jgi:glucosamine-6-phosphate deaminase
MPDSNLHFPKADTALYRKVGKRVCGRGNAGGQGDVKHWAFKTRRDAKAIQKRLRHLLRYRKLTTRVVDLHR